MWDGDGLLDLVPLQQWDEIFLLGMPAYMTVVDHPIGLTFTQHGNYVNKAFIINSIRGLPAIY